MYYPKIGLAKVELFYPLHPYLPNVQSNLPTDQRPLSCLLKQASIVGVTKKLSYIKIPTI